MSYNVYKNAYYLQHPLRQSRLLTKLLQVLGIRVMVDGEIGLHGPQLVMLEAGAHAFGARCRPQATSATETHLQVLSIQIWLEKNSHASKC